MIYSWYCSKLVAIHAYYRMTDVWTFDGHTDIWTDPNYIVFKSFVTKFIFATRISVYPVNARFPV